MFRHRHEYRFSTAALAVTAAAMLVATTTASSAAADTSTRVTLPSPNEPELLTADATTTPLDSTTQLSLRVYLAPRPGLAAAASAISTPGSAAYDHFLTADQFNDQFGTTAAQSTAVSDWLSAEGMTITATTSHYIAVTATVADVNSAFDTTVSQYYSATDDWNLPGVVGGFSVPAALGGYIESVTGIDQLVLAQPTSGGKGTAETTAKKATVEKANAVTKSVGKATAKAAVKSTAKAAVKASADTTSTSFQCSQYWGQYTGAIPEAYGHTSAPTALCGYTPNQIRSAYGISSSPYTGKGATIAIISTDYHPTMQADADEYFSGHDEAGFASGQFSDVILPTVAASCAGNDQEVDPEEPIDVESAHIAAPDAKIVNVATDCEQTSAGGEFLQDSLDGVTAVVDGHLADIVSGSFGLSEPVDAPADMAAWDPIFEEGAVEGIGFDFSSGDGGDLGSDYDVHNAQFPATDPWVTAVGGTSTAIGANGNVIADYPWGDNYAQIDSAGTGYTSPAPPGTYSGGSGGGVSSVYPEPAYQDAAVPATLATDSGTTQASRVIPDLSADAGLGWMVGWTGAVTDGTYAELPAGGGTSASTPLIAGLEADAIQAAGHPLGFINPLLYTLDGTSAIHDVLPVDPADPPILDGDQTVYGGIDTTQLTTLGEDVGLTTTTGYDDTTGLGAPTTSFVTALADR